jgi:hypothetical protein
MNRFAAVLLALVLVALPASAEFSELARALEHRVGNRTWIPMFGLARTLVRMVHPKGVHDVQLAVFEDARRIDGKDLEKLMRLHAGRGFTPLVTVRGKNEATFVYARPLKADRLELTVLTQDGSDTVLVRVSVAADVVTRELGNARQIAQLGRR